jgi:uncharacterized protein YbjT (DUF2867 family)
MNVVLFGSTGMIGQGVLRECLLDPGVKRVVTVNRRPSGKSDPKLHEIVHPDLFDLAPIERDLVGLDACFYCLGVTSVGMSEPEYTRITYELTMSIAETLVRLNPNMTFIFVSGAGTDSTEQKGAMWARVKGKAENGLLKLPFRAAYVFRPGALIPMHGIRSSTPMYNTMYAVLRPLVPLVRLISPNMFSTTEQMGRAMVAVARAGYPKRILEMPDIRTF